MTELPLFPLESVLLPYGRFPLRIFEQRYLDLVRECLREDVPFGLVWIRRGHEVAQKGRAAPQLGDYGTVARIVDWDQLPDGLLGVTVEGGERFDLFDTGMRANGLVTGQVAIRDPLPVTRMKEDWLPLLDVLRSLETHPHVERMNLRVDYNSAWEVGFTLAQLLPLDEVVKYQLLGSATVDVLMGELDGILNEVSGED